MTFLIVDDEPLILDGIIKGIDWNQLQDANVLMARDQEQAKALFSQERIEVLVTDIEMGDTNGLDLIQWVKAKSPETKCIVLSCHDEFGFAQRAVKLGCFDYILKPIPFETLTQALLRAQKSVQQEKYQAMLKHYGKEYAKKLGADSAEPVSGTIEAATEYINRHIGEDFSVEILAGYVHMSPRNLNRLFRKEYEMSVGEYITYRRMLLASELLKKPTYSVTLVSDQVGYSNYSYFIKQFKKHYGCTPKEYQRQFGEGVAQEA